PRISTRPWLPTPPQLSIKELRPARGPIKEPRSMPHIKPASREAKAAHRQGLPPELRSTFDELARALANWRYDLDRYHQVGTLLRHLRQGGTPEGGGPWLKGLPGALNVSPGLFVKAIRFAQLYPKKKDVRELEEMSVDWTRVTLAFPVKERADRHELLDA